jgi:hypothetical protein
VGGHQQHQFEPELRARVPRDREMSEVWRVERTAEDAE